MGLATVADALFLPSCLHVPLSFSAFRRLCKPQLCSPSHVLASANVRHWPIFVAAAFFFRTRPKLFRFLGARWPRPRILKNVSFTYPIRVVRLPTGFFSPSSSSWFCTQLPFITFMEPPTFYRLVLCTGFWLLALSQDPPPSIATTGLGFPVLWSSRCNLLCARGATQLLFSRFDARGLHLTTSRCTLLLLYLCPFVPCSFLFFPLPSG